MTLRIKENEVNLPAWQRAVRDAVNRIIGDVDDLQAEVPSAGPFTMPEVTAASVANPPTGSQAVFIDSADHKLKRKNSAGAVTIIG